MKSKLLLLCLSLWLLEPACRAQIPGFIEKWKVTLDTTSAVDIEAVGRDGAVLAGYPSATAPYQNVWIASSGDVIATMPDSEFTPANPTNLSVFVTVLVLNSNLVVQAQEDPGAMQITQISRSGGLLQTTKTQFLAPALSPSSSRDASLSDFSCPERLMFVQQANLLTCYRPAADVTLNPTSLAMGGVSGGRAQLFVTSPQGGPLQLQGSTNLTKWQSVTNVQTRPGTTEIIAPAPARGRYYYRGMRQ